MTELLRRALVLLMIACLPAFAGDWKEATYDDDDDIRVFTRSVKGSDMNAFRAVTHVKSTLAAPVALLQDTARTQDWVFKCKAMALIEEQSETQALYYMVTEMPWPVKNRDSISETTISQDPVSKAVRVDVAARNDVWPENDDNIRIRKMNGYWLFTPKGDGVIEVTYEAHADPGGGLPSWLVNSFVVDAPLNTLRGFRRLIGEEQYQGAERPFITH